MPDPFVYAIQQDGKLLWYSHDGRADGTFNWQGPNEVGTGWNGFSTVFSGGANFGVVETLGGSFCGVPDQGGGIGPLTFGSPGGRWTRGALKVLINSAGANFVNATPTAPNAVAVIMAAFTQWQSPPPLFLPSFFTFSFVTPPTPADIRVIFGGTAADPRFGSLRGVIASAGYPEQGNLQFDSIEVWNPNNLLSTALHEIGHLLGLSHSNAPGATMNPFVNTALTIDTESRIAIAAIYGWQPQQRAGDGGTSHRASLGVTSVTNFAGTSQTPHMVWKGVSGDSNAYYSFFDFANDPIWKPQRRIEYFSYETGGGIPYAIGTSGALSAAVRGNSIILTWKGVEDDSTIYFSLFANNEFSGQATVPNVGTSVGPSVVQADGRTFMAWKGINGDTGIYWSRL